MSTLFNDKLTQPTDEMLVTVLGQTKEYIDSIIRFISTEFGECHPEWKYYGSKYGWSMKIFNNKRNVLFLGPEQGYFNVAFAFGEKAYLQIMNSDLPETIKEQIAASKAYVEGRPLRLEIRNEGNLELLFKLIKIKLDN